MRDDISCVTAKAPGSVSNLAVGFDILGMAIDGPCDTVTLTRRADEVIEITEIVGGDDLPLDPNQNTATIAVQAFLQSLSISAGFSVLIHKGIPLGSGLGGSAASAVAALVACNHFLKTPQPVHALLPFAIQAEAASAGAAHADNVAPALLGGLVMCAEDGAWSLPTPPLACVVMHVDIAVSTKHARTLLPRTVTLSAHTQATAQLGMFIHALHTQDADLFARVLYDAIVEPARAALWPHYAPIKQAALSAGAKAVCMSGSGPTVLAWVQPSDATSVSEAMLQAANSGGWQAQYWISEQPAQGASCEL